MGSSLGPDNPEKGDSLDEFVERIKARGDKILKDESGRYPIDFRTDSGKIIAQYGPNHSQDPHAVWELVRSQHAQGNVSDHTLETSTYLLEEEGLILSEREKEQMAKIPGYIPRRK